MMTACTYRPITTKCRMGYILPQSGSLYVSSAAAPCASMHCIGSPFLFYCRIHSAVFLYGTEERTMNLDTSHTFLNQVHGTIPVSQNN